MIAKNNEKGSTMIETIMYIAVLIVLGTTLAKGAANVFGRYKVGRLAQQIIDLKKSIISFTAINEDYTQLSMEAMKKANALPLDMKSLTHALAGKIEFGPATEIATVEDTNNKYMFYVKFHSIRQEACIELLTQGQFFTDGSEMDSLQVNNNYCWKYPYSLFKFGSCGYTTTLTKQHLEMNDGIKGCTKKNSNTITWIFS